MLEKRFDSNDKTVVLIDGHSLMFRAFFAVPSSLKSPDGRPTNAITGFLSMMLGVVEQLKPQSLVCVFDKGKPQHRLDLLPNYKGNREKPDPSLIKQFEPLQELLSTVLRIPVVIKSGWEGDDLLGTLAQQAHEQGFKSYILTGDRDTFQLVNENSRVYLTKRGSSVGEIFDEEEVRKLFGVWPHQIPDFYGMKGDGSDNIPGVSGIGPKIGADLIQKYGSIENVYEHIDDFKGARRKNLEEHKDCAFLSREVATIRRDAPIDELDFKNLRFPAYNIDELTKGFMELGLFAQLKRFVQLIGEEGSENLVEKSKVKLFAGRLISEPEEAFKTLESAFARGTTLGLFYEEDCAAQLFSDAKLYVSTGCDVLLFRAEYISEALIKIVRRGRFVCSGLKALMQQLIPADSSIETEIQVQDISIQRCDDIELMAYLLDSSRTNYALDHLLEQYAQLMMPEADEEHPEGAWKAAACAILCPFMQKRLQEEGSFACYRDIELPLTPVLLSLERAGMQLDVELLKKLSQDAEEHLQAISEEIFALAGESFNIESPKQLSAILFEKLALTPGKKTKTGYSTDATTLEKLVSEHEIISKIIEHREYSKLKSTYLDVLPHLLAGDNRVHSSFNQTVANTGRLSSSHPNLQNIPVRTQHGRQIRRAFIVDDDKYFVSFDYSQIELRLLAHLSHDEGLCAAFKHGADFHTATAARIFSIEPEEVSPEMRSRAKAVNFGIVYGQQAFGLSQSLGISMEEAQDMITRYFEAYPRVRSYLDGLVTTAKANGFVETMFGRKRHIADLKSARAASRAFGERSAMNHPMQGSAADIIKLAMIEVQKRLNGSSLSAKMIVQVHDELDFECPKHELDQLVEIVQDAMEGVVQLEVPLIVEVSAARNWAEAK